VQAAFLILPSYRRFPSNEEFQREIKIRDLYNFRSRSYWLRRLENHGRKERVLVEDYTVEHILPQNEKLSEEWKAELGPEWKRVQQTWLHTLGNLTLTGYNSEYSDSSFKYKQEQIESKDGNKIGFKYSPLNLNFGLGEVSQWDETAIQARAERLAIKASQTWAMPALDDEILRQYDPIWRSLDEDTQYNIDDHPHLAAGAMRALFEEFRQAVLALDPCIREEFLKLYVAYKAETNFVDVVPQAKRLRLSLNMPFHELDDPKGLCKDVSNLGRWGNGDVEVGLSNLDELPYVMGLIRQSFDRQMGGPQDD